MTLRGNHFHLFTSPSMTSWDIGGITSLPKQGFMNSNLGSNTVKLFLALASVNSGGWGAGRQFQIANFRGGHASDSA